MAWPQIQASVTSRESTPPPCTRESVTGDHEPLPCSPITPPLSLTPPPHEHTLKNSTLVFVLYLPTTTAGHCITFDFYIDVPWKGFYAFLRLRWRGIRYRLVSHLENPPPPFQESIRLCIWSCIRHPSSYAPDQHTPSGSPSPTATPLRSAATIDPRSAVRRLALDPAPRLATDPARHLTPHPARHLTPHPATPVGKVRHPRGGTVTGDHEPLPCSPITPPLSLTPPPHEHTLKNSTLVFVLYLPTTTAGHCITFDFYIDVPWKGFYAFLRLRWRGLRYRLVSHLESPRPPPLHERIGHRRPRTPSMLAYHPSPLTHSSSA